MNDEMTLRERVYSLPNARRRAMWHLKNGHRLDAKAWTMFVLQEEEIILLLTGRII